jgi:hypothetical protein
LIIACSFVLALEAPASQLHHLVGRRRAPEVRAFGTLRPDFAHLRIVAMPWARLEQADAVVDYLIDLAEQLGD